MVTQEEDFDEDEGIYDELNLSEEEEKFGLAQDENESDDSEDASEGLLTPPDTRLLLIWRRHPAPNTVEVQAA